MRPAVPRLQAAEAFGLDPFRAPVARNMRDLFRPLDDLLLSGGDPRLTLDPATRLNRYGCAPTPQPESWSFASSTASTISERAYLRVAHAREELMRSAIAVGLDEAFDARIEEMRAELKAQLGLGRDIDVVFAPSGTDAQLQALFIARARLGGAVSTIVVGSDQTGSGTAATARGRHFGAVTAAGRDVDKNAAIAGLACDSVALPLAAARGKMRLRPDADLAVLDAIERVMADGGRALLQIMDSSKLGWRAPSEACLGEIARQWPDQVQVVVDACQMRLGRGRIRACLDRGYLVLITGSKYFGGPAFAGALLVPAALSRPLSKRSAKVAHGLLDYTSRSDWPKDCKTLRGRLESRNNLGQWLRWEAALEEMRSYYAVPDAFRTRAVRELRAGIEDLIKLTPSLRAVESFAGADSREDEEFAGATIFAFAVEGADGLLSPEQCRALYRTLTRDVSKVVGASSADREIAARHCLLGQPVTIERAGEPPVAALRLCIGARLVTEAWSEDATSASRNLEHQLDCVASVIAKIELLLAHASPKCVGHPDGI